MVSAYVYHPVKADEWGTQRLTSCGRCLLLKHLRLTCALTTVFQQPVPNFKRRESDHVCRYISMFYAENLIRAVDPDCCASKEDGYKAPASCDDSKTINTQHMLKKITKTNHRTVQCLVFPSRDMVGFNIALPKPHATVNW